MSYQPIDSLILGTICPDMPSANLYTLVNPLNAAMEEFEINTPLRQAAFLAQIAHETGGFKWFRELGPDSYFQKYEGRADLGNVSPGDGLRFKGRGFIQITGRHNYQKAGAALGIDLVSRPGWAEAVDVGARIAGWFWLSRGLNDLADRSEFTLITRRINGGTNGLDDRKRYYARALKALTA